MTNGVAKLLVGSLFLLFTVNVHAAMPSGDTTLVIAKDNTRVYGHFYRALNNNPKIALLFHQAGSNSMEYEPVLSSFHVAGFDTLTIDQRSGGTRWGNDNLTVKRLGVSTEYEEAYSDLQAALNYAIKRKYRKILLVGSSYSASLAIVLASENPDKVIAVAAFSPGEYFTDKNKIKNAAAKLTIPLYITGTKNEKARVEEVLVKLKGGDVTYYRPTNAVHGASMLRKSMNKEGYKANMESFNKFLHRFK